MDRELFYPQYFQYAEEKMKNDKRVIHEDGWHIGKIDYFNNKLGEYHVKFRSDEDYLKKSDIDGVEMILLP